MKKFIVLLVAIAMIHSFNRVLAQRIEIESNYQVVNNVGSNGSLYVDYSSNNSNGAVVRLSDNGDELSVSINIPQSGTYDFSVWVRCGSNGNSTRFWPTTYDSYEFSIEGIGVLNFTGDVSTISPYYNDFGGVYWGLMEAKNISIGTAGTKIFHIKSNDVWLLVDYMEVTNISPPVTPTAPSNLSSSNVTSSSLQLNWTDNSNDEDNFIVERNANGAGYQVLTSTVVANSTTYTDNSVSANGSYQYRIASKNTGGQSAFSNEITVNTTSNAPTAPSNLSSSNVTSSSLQLNWTDNSNNEDNFVIERNANGAGFQVLTSTVAANSTTYTDNSVSANGSYQYRVASKNSSGQSAFSNSITASTPSDPGSGGGSTAWVDDGNNNITFSSGNVGIGTNNVSEKLVVKGTVLAEEVKVQNVPASDYVFESDYNLRPIKEVESFIKESKHLPDIPSAEEFKTNGVGLGEMDNMLLRKVEELTLYVIELQKQMNQLKEGNIQLKEIVQRSEY